MIRTFPHSSESSSGTSATSAVEGSTSSLKMQTLTLVFHSSKAVMKPKYRSLKPAWKRGWQHFPHGLA